MAGADTVYQGRQYVGAGRLDSERRTIGTFDAQVDDIGILNDRPENVRERDDRRRRWTSFRSASGSWARRFRSSPGAT